MGFHPGEAVVFEGGGDFQPFGDGTLFTVGDMETIAAGGEKPDSGREFRGKFEGFHVFDEFFGGAADCLGFKVG
jgi:hypothetical protein